MYQREITYNGKTQCLSYWAKEYGISNTAFSYWFYDYGIDVAIELACMDRSSRQVYKSKLRGFEVKGNPELPKHDPVQHFVDNLTQSLKAEGYTDTEIEREVIRRWAA